MQNLFVFIFFISLLSLFLVTFGGESSTLAFVEKKGRKKLAIALFLSTIISFFALSFGGENIKEPIVINKRDSIASISHYVSNNNDKVVNTESCVDINSAEKNNLVLIKHISENRAEDLISLRPFQSLDDLVKIKGIGSARLNDIKDQGLACVK